MIFCDTITLFNTLKDGYSTYYYTTVLKNVSLQVALDSTTSNTGANPNNNVKLYIMNDSNLSKAYISPNLWQVNEQKDRYFTLKQGDIIAKGEILPQYIDYQNIRSTYDNVYTVAGVNCLSDTILPHWEVILK